MSMTYKVYVVGDHGQGYVTPLQDWDGVDELKLDLSVFDHNAVITIEQESQS